MGRHTLSTVYEYFNYDKQTQESICNNCNGKIKGKHGTNLKRHLSSHQDLYEEMLVKDKVKKKSSAKTTTSVIKAHEKLFHFSTPEVKVNINMNTLISACVDLVTINGRPYSLQVY
uniref:BED-type domain-containing protein n=1 Tax=Schizaphis graminum TaxID=13262 RepID=A0A2S2P0C5_SCHGA